MCLLAEVSYYPYLGRQVKIEGFWSLGILQTTHITATQERKQIVHSWSISELYFISIYTVWIFWAKIVLKLIQCYYPESWTAELWLETLEQSGKSTGLN